MPTLPYYQGNCPRKPIIAHSLSSCVVDYLHSHSTVICVPICPWAPTDLTTTNFRCDTKNLWQWHGALLMEGDKCRSSSRNSESTTRQGIFSDTCFLSRNIHEWWNKRALKPARNRHVLQWREMKWLWYCTTVTIAQAESYLFGMITVTTEPWLKGEDIKHDTTRKFLVGVSPRVHPVSEPIRNKAGFKKKPLNTCFIIILLSLASPT